MRCNLQHSQTCDASTQYDLDDVRLSTCESSTQYNLDDIYSFEPDVDYPRTSTPLHPSNFTETSLHDEQRDTSFSFSHNSSMSLPIQLLNKVKPRSTTPRLDDDTKFIIFSSCIQSLLQYCPSCGAPTASLTQFCTGTLLTVNISCLNGHAVKLNVAADILFSEQTYQRLSHFADILKLAFISESTYYRIQDQYVFPVIDEIWKSHQETLLQSKVNPVSIIGDGRCDSPGYSAKYCTYTVMEQSSDKILEFPLIQVSEVANLPAMEKVGLERCLQKLSTAGVTVQMLATDRHLQITSFMKEDHAYIKHQFDVWHFAKAVVSKEANKKIVNTLFRGSNPYQTIHGSLQNPVMEIQNSLKKNGCLYSITLQMYIYGLLQTSFWSVITLISLQMIEHLNGG